MLEAGAEDKSSDFEYDEDIIEELRTQVQEKEIELLNQKQKYIAALNQAKALQLKLEAAETEIKLQKDTYDSLAKEAEKNLRELSEANKQLAEMKVIARDSNSEVNRVVLLYEKMESKFGTELKRLQGSTRKAQQSALDQQRISAMEIMKLKSENESLRSLLASTKEQETTNRDKIRKLELQNEALEQENLSLRKKIDSPYKPKRTNSNEKIFISPLKSFHVDQFGDSTMLEEGSIIAELNKLREENKQLIKQNQSFQESEEFTGSMIGVNKSLLEDVKNLRRENKKLINENEVLSEGEICASGSDVTEEEIEVLHNSFNLAEQYDRVCHERDELQKLVDKLQAQLHENESLEVKSHIERMERMNKWANDEYSSDDGANPDEIIAIKRENSTLKKLITSFDTSTQHGELIKRLQDAENMCSEAQTRADDLEKENLNLRERLTKMEKYDYEVENEELRDKIAELEKQLRHKDEQYEFYTETAVMNHRIKELEADLIKKENFDNDVATNLAEQLEYYEDQCSNMEQQIQSLTRKLAAYENLEDGEIANSHNFEISEDDEIANSHDENELSDPAKISMDEIPEEEESDDDSDIHQYDEDKLSDSLKLDISIDENMSFSSGDELNEEDLLLSDDNLSN